MEKTKVNKFGMKLYYFLKAARFELLIITVAFFLLGEWLSVEKIPLFQTIIGLLSLSGLMSSGSYINHIFDKNLDQAAGKKKIGLIDFWDYISIRELSLVTFVLIFISLFILFLINIYTFFMGLLIIFSIIFYSVPPLRCKGRAPFDLVMLALEFSTLPFFLGWLTNGFISNMFFVYGFIFGLVIISVHLLFDVIIIDVDEEKKYGLKSSCVILGYNNSVNIGIILFFLSLFLSIFFVGIDSFITISILICSPFFFFSKIYTKPAQIGLLISISVFLWEQAIFLFLFILSKSIIPLIPFIINLATLILKLFGVYKN
jgi:4-hydroxybenzoate polyprenyltransferase